MTALLLSCALKATVLLTLAALACTVARRASAAFRHRIWTLALTAALLLPILQFSLRFAPASLPAATAVWRSVPLLPAATQLVSSASSYTINAAPGSPWHQPWLLWLWLAGVTLACLRLVAGLSRLFWISSRARACHDPRMAAALQRCARPMGFARRVRVRILSGAHEMPCTWGLFRPVVLLPRTCAEWPDQRRDIVLKHELAHIQRLDWPLGLLAEAARALYWFHPLVWLAIRNLRHESERACDDAVLSAGEDCTRYAGELLHLVRTASGSRASLSTALAVARPSNLSRRITAMLDTTVNRRRLTRRAALFSTAATLLLLLPLAALRAPAEDVAGRFTGAVTDPRGTAVPSATVIMTNSKTHAREMTATDASGLFEFNALPAGDYDIRVVKPGFAEYSMQPMVLDAARDIVHNVSLALGAVTENIRVTGAPAESPTVAARPSRIPVGSTVQAAALTLKVVPTYPSSAKASHTQGAVLLEAVIGLDGVPQSLQVMGNADPDLARAAVEAVSQWRYRPTLLNGEPIEVQTNITVNFTLLP